jgi:hypothetical protein
MVAGPKSILLSTARALPSSILSLVNIYKWPPDSSRCVHPPSASPDVSAGWSWIELALRRWGPGDYLGSSGYRSSLSMMPSSSRRGFSSSRYCWYWPLFSTFALIPVTRLSALSARPFLALLPVSADLVLTLEDPHGGGEIVNPSGGFQGGNEHGRRGDQVVGEGVVQVALRCRSRGQPSADVHAGFFLSGRSRFAYRTTYLELKNILNAVKLLLVSVPVLTSAIEFPESLDTVTQPGGHGIRHALAPILPREVFPHLAVNSSKVSS